MTSISNHLLDRAKDIVREVNDEIRSSHQIADRIREMPPYSDSDLPARVQKLGLERMIQFHLQGAKRERLQEAYGLSAQTGSFTGISLALGQFGVGDCGEMAAAALIKTMKFTHSMLVCLGKSEELVGDNHVFLVLFQNESEISGDLLAIKKVDALLSRLPKNAVVLDPFLRLACKVSDIAKEGIDFFEYNRVWGVEDVYALKAYKINSQYEKTFVHEAEKIYQAIKEKLPFTKRNGFCANFLRRVAQNVCVVLGNAFPDTEWKSNIKDGITVFLTCSKQKGEEISARLQKSGIQFKSSRLLSINETCIILYNPPIPEKLKEALNDSNSKS